MKKQIGIWLDFKKADVILLAEDQIRVEEVISELEDFHVVGGSRSKSPWGPMDKVSEGKFLERRKHQMKKYFDKLLARIKDGDELYLFGPAEAKKLFAKEFKKLKKVKPELLAVELADSITMPQKIARVKAFFKA